jgi:hypothetical protein
MDKSKANTLDFFTAYQMHESVSYALIALLMADSWKIHRQVICDIPEAAFYSINS